MGNVLSIDRTPSLQPSPYGRGSAVPLLRDITWPYASSRQPHIQQPPAFALQQFFHRAGGDDFVLVGVGLVVLFDILETIEIVDHDPGGFAQALWRQIAEPIDPLQPCAVAE